ncbi:MAG TPA: hypothetical protein VE991_05695 [Acidimicrobiales bacterium]|nr:hypothetical protein [Acidimicrobiales bacterium]
MSAAHAELSSLSSALADLTRRVAGIAEQASSDKDDELSTELFAVERALRGAGRRLERLNSIRRRTGS